MKKRQDCCYSNVMKNILEIYKEYDIMPSLAEHQLSVAGVAMQICENIKDVKIDKDEIIKTCLLHDMGNIIKFNLTYFPEFLEPQGLEYWIKIQSKYIDKYGADEHRATIAIGKELKMNDSIIELLDSVGFTQSIKNEDDEDFDKKIVSYADARVYPKGVCLLEERFENLRERYVKEGSSLKKIENNSKHFQKESFEEAMREIEKQIFSKCNINPEDITNESVVSYIEKLKQFEI